MKRARVLWIAAGLAAVPGAWAIAADDAVMEKGRQAERTGCVPCHSLRLVDSQRLSRAAWDRELTKMAGWGWTAKPEERAALLEYLVANFGADKTAAAPERSRDGRK